MLVLRIPYIGREPRESSEAQESWGLSDFVSQVLAGLKDSPLEDDELSVHQAIFVVLSDGL